ncbi:MAG TPA: VOC family protein [Tepidisphaeraceae bacterium]|jgi:catechol 2,3-dioxygenase-like lactoylglutathione lyase family enzyme
MRRVTGLGGVFFKAADPTGLAAWYERHLGLSGQGGIVNFLWREREGDSAGTTVWSVFPKDTEYFRPSQAPFMLNYRVADLDALLEALRAEGVEIDPRREDSEYGRFAWIMDPEGNRVELWEPPKGS